MFNIKAHIWEYDKEIFTAIVPEIYKNIIQDTTGSLIYRMFSQIYHMCQCMKFIIDNEKYNEEYDYIILTRTDNILYNFDDSIFNNNEYVFQNDISDLTYFNGDSNIYQANDHFQVIPRKFLEKRASCFNNIQKYMYEYFIPKNIIPWPEALFGYHDMVLNIPKNVTPYFNSCIYFNHYKRQICENILKNNLNI